MPRMGNIEAAQSQIWKDSQAPGGDNPSKSGLSVRLPGTSPGLSGSDHEDSCGCSSVSVYQLMGSDKGPKHCGEWKQFCRCLGPLPDFTNSQKTKGSFDAFFCFKDPSNCSLSLFQPPSQTLMLWQALNTGGEKDIHIWGPRLHSGKELPAKCGLEKKFSQRLCEDKPKKHKP